MESTQQSRAAGIQLESDTGSSLTQPEEEWRPTEFEWYEVSNHGRVRSWRQSGTGKRRSTPKLLAPAWTGNRGNQSLSVHFSVEGAACNRSVHRLVYAAFGSGAPYSQVFHRDGDKTNNHISNLTVTRPPKSK